METMNCFQFCFKQIIYLIFILNFNNKFSMIFLLNFCGVSDTPVVDFKFLHLQMNQCFTLGQVQMLVTVTQSTIHLFVNIHILFKQKMKM